jgi:hypothetical protein
VQWVDVLAHDVLEHSQVEIPIAGGVAHDHRHVLQPACQRGAVGPLARDQPVAVPVGATTSGCSSPCVAIEPVPRGWLSPSEGATCTAAPSSARHTRLLDNPIAVQYQ